MKIEHYLSMKSVVFNAESTYASEFRSERWVGGSQDLARVDGEEIPEETAENCY
jgi:hypothetical protein